MNPYPRQSRLPFVVLSLLLSAAASMRAAEPEPAPPTPAPKDRVVVLDAYEILGQPPKLCFGLSLEVWKDNDSGKVKFLYIAKVRPGSEAEKLGLKPRTRIDRIDGRPVEELTASFIKGRDLGDLFVNRKRGAKVTLEVLIEGQTKTKVVTLTEKPWIQPDIRPHKWDDGPWL